MKNKKLLGILGITALLLAGNFAWREAKEVDAATPATLYLSPGAWSSDGARYAAYFFGNGEKWVSFADNNKDGFYEVTVPSGFSKVILCRMNGSNSTNNWNNKWNQTSNSNKADKRDTPEKNSSITALHKAAEQGNTDAQNNLGYYYDQHKAGLCQK